MKLDKDKQYWTTNKKTAKYLYLLGFDYTMGKSYSGNKIYIFDKSDRLMDAVNLYIDIRGQNRLKQEGK